MSNFSLTPVAADQISSTSLQNEIETNPGESFECYRFRVEGTAEVGSLIYAEGRAGIAWGADPQWTDASGAEDAMERFLGLGLGGKEMCN